MQAILLIWPWYDVGFPRSMSLIDFAIQRIYLFSPGITTAFEAINLIVVGCQVSAEDVLDLFDYPGYPSV